MGKIIWLASYPKSGNTWLRVLLTNYLRDGEAPADINDLTGVPIASARVWFDEWVGVEASMLSDTVIERLRPDVYRCMAREAPDVLYMKVHDACGRTDRDELLFPVDVTAGAIYVLRNPLDMAASCAHHWGVSVPQAVQNLCDPTFATARSLGGLTDQLRQSLGAWSDHVRSWLDHSGLPVHIIRYEDLQRDPEASFAAMIRFCSLPEDRARVHKAVVFSAWSELRRQEQSNGFRERSVAAPGPFFRKGQAGAWRDELTPDLVQQLIQTHGEVMRRFGYLDKHDRPI